MTSTAFLTRLSLYITFSSKTLDKLTDWRFLHSSKRPQLSQPVELGACGADAGRVWRHTILVLVAVLTARLAGIPYSSYTTRNRLRVREIISLVKKFEDKWIILIYLLCSDEGVIMFVYVYRPQIEKTWTIRRQEQIIIIVIWNSITCNAVGSQSPSLSALVAGL